jgi:integrase
MATVRKRLNKSGKASWQIDYFDPNGKRIRKSFKKKKDAEAELGKRVSLIAENRYLDVKKDYKTTLGELVKDYAKNYKNQASFKNAKKTYLENFKEYFGEDTLLANIRYKQVETYRNHLRQKLTRHDTIRSDASVNREMSCLHHLFDKAEEWEMIETSPFNRGKSLMLKENNQRVRFLNEDEIEKLLSNCPPHLKRVVVCALNTGMRRQEILSLQWSQIRNDFIYLRKTKTNEARQIPVNGDLAKLFKEIKAEKNPKGNVIALDGKPANVLQLNTNQVFTFGGRPIDGVKSSFKTALKNAGIADFRFHDLRHTFASQLIMKGGTLKDVQELLGHKTMTMTLRYAHHSQQHKKKAVNLLNGLTANSSVSQKCHKVPTGEKQQPVSC